MIGVLTHNHERSSGPTSGTHIYDNDDDNDHDDNNDDGKISLMKVLKLNKFTGSTSDYHSTIRATNYDGECCHEGTSPICDTR